MLPELEVSSYLLLVDDDPDVLCLVSVLLENAGYEIQTALSAIEALRVIRELGPPRLGVFDVAMPELSGLDLVRVLRGRDDTADLPVVFVSARVHPSDVEAGQALGATYIKKPFEVGALLDAVAKNLAAAEARRSQKAV